MTAPLRQRACDAPSTLAVPLGPEAVTRGWLSAVLGREIDALRLERVGVDEGFTGTRLYRAEMGAAGQVIVKLASEDAALRARFAAENAREVAFYHQFAAGLPVPGCFYAASDPVAGASVVVLEDLGGARAVPFVTGLDRKEALAAVRALAQAHAVHWDAGALAGLPGSAVADELGFADCWAGYEAALQELLPGAELSPELRTLGAALAGDAGAVLGPLLDAGPLTLRHGDAQADNLMFAADAALLLDWQFMARGRGGADLAYLLISSLRPETRRADEAALVESYLVALAARGIDYPRERLWQDYRRGAAVKLLMSVVATVGMDNRGPAKQAWRRADLARLVAFCADHGTDQGADYSAGERR
ncbi:oxidoreductase family protein [Roseovarius sp. C7]|uniref:oxidoreductase family protein n=1 Tax=Roseovarius sp. C7 TaxID=3398643 RepID=UPI0039F698A6